MPRPAPIPPTASVPLATFELIISPALTSILPFLAVTFDPVPIIADVASSISSTDTALKSVPLPLLVSVY